MNQFNPRGSQGPVSTAREGVPPERKFRLALTIKDNPAIEGAHALLVLAKEDGKSTPVLVIEAGGVEATHEGAAKLAGMFSDAAGAIEEYLVSEGVMPVSHHTQELPVVRPRFNPKPAGGGK
jgi:hypothetical protein